MQLIHWFHADPRRFCVLGAWLDLLGCGVTFHALVTGAPAANLLVGIALTLAGTAAKVTGRDRFKLRRLERHRANGRTVLRPELS